MIVFKDSFKNTPEGQKLKPVLPNERIEITIRIRRKKSIERALKELEKNGKIYTREEYREEFGLSKEDVKKIHDFANAKGLSVAHASYSRRSMILVGTAQNLTKAFGVSLYYYKTNNGRTFRGRSGSFKIPKSLKGIIAGIFGLDNRPQTFAKYKLLGENKRNTKRRIKSFNPDELARLYNFPKADGNNQCIGIIEFGGGHSMKDMEHYFNSIHSPMPTIKSVSVGNAHNNPGTVDDNEVALDIEVAGTIAPNATIVLYYAQNSAKGFIDSITQAVHDNKNKPSVISISWGGAEVRWSKQAMKNFTEVCKAAALMGVTICVATGDAGSDDKVSDGKAHVDFPASCPYVLACGGTTLTSYGKKIMNEIAWNKAPNAATGGGVSSFFRVPDYQKKTRLPSSANGTRFKGRGIPDLAAHADFKTGYRIYYRGAEHIAGGTSAVAPLIAGLIARINQIRNKPAGFINSFLYKSPFIFRDITKGNNDTSADNEGYKAGKGWDATTGLGVVDGMKLLTLLANK